MLKKMIFRGSFLASNFSQGSNWNLLKPGVQTSEILPAHTEIRHPPSNLVHGDKSLFAHELKRSWGPCNVIELTHVNMLGSSWVQWRYLRLVDEFKPSHFPFRRKRGRIRDSFQLGRKSQRIHEALWVHDEWSDNYFHWLTDVLPKLFLWKEAGHSCRTVLLPQRILKNKYVLDSLGRLGFQSIEAKSTNLMVDKLFIIEPTAPTGNFRSNLLCQLRKSLAKPSDGRCRRMIYVDRSDASRRFLVNETSLRSILYSYGFQIERLGSRGLDEQIELFSSCTFIAGLHGAGLANMIFMPPGSHVVEIRRRGDSHNNCFFAMANALGHAYSYLLADDIQPGQTSQAANLVLGPNLLNKLLHDLCSS